MLPTALPQRLIACGLTLLMVLALALTGARTASAASSTVQASSAIVVRLSTLNQRSKLLRAALPRACRRPASRRCRTHKARIAQVDRSRRLLRRHVRPTRATGRPAQDVRDGADLGASAAADATPAGRPSSSTGASSQTAAGTTAAGAAATAAGAATSAATAATTAASTTPPVGSAPIAPTAPPAGGDASSGFQPGVTASQWTNHDVGAVSTLGAKVVRVDFDIDQPLSDVERVVGAYAAAGVRVAPMASFFRRMPTVDEARSLAAWARSVGPGGTFWRGRSDGALAIRAIEFGNETSMTYQYGDDSSKASFTARARTYALRIKDAHDAIADTGVDVGLLAQDDDWSGTWMNGMYDAVPGFDRYISGWTVHPYGTNWRGRIQDTLRHADAHGAPRSLSVNLTEFGLSSDDGRCLDDNYGYDKCMTFAQAGTALRDATQGMRSLLGNRLGLLCVYSAYDLGVSGADTDREMYFGALDKQLQPKGAYTTAVKAFLAS